MSDAATHIEAPEAGHGHEMDIKKHVRVYMIVFGSLAVLTVVTVAVAYLNLPIIAALIIALLIASVKGGLVAAYFMHLIDERKVILFLLFATAVFLAGMFILFIWAHNAQDGASLVP